MALSWHREATPTWDEPKQQVLGSLGELILGLPEITTGQRLADEWWCVQEDGLVVGFGRLDDTWGDAEIVVAVEPESQGAGVGAFILEHLEEEASKRGLNYVYNVVPTDHPDYDEVRGWFLGRGFTPGTDEELRKQLT